jgi:hypothetical protein
MEARDDARFVQKHRHEFGRAREVRQDAFDCRGSPEPARTFQATEEHLGHASVGEKAEDLVATDPLALGHAGIVPEAVDGVGETALPGE